MNENGLHPAVSIAIIILCLIFMSYTGHEYLQQNQLCVNVPISGDVVYNACVGREQQRQVPLPPMQWA